MSARQAVLEIGIEESAVRFDLQVEDVIAHALAARLSHDID